MSSRTVENIALALITAAPAITILVTLALT